MKANTIITFSMIFALCIGFSSCKEKSHYTIIKVKSCSVAINNQYNDNQYLAATETLKKYCDKVHQITQDTIGYCDYVLSKEGKENLLCNYSSDALLHIGNQLFDSINIDLALINSGGIRVDIPEGYITVGNIYEVYPFDNAITLVSLRGSDVKALFETFAKRSRFEALSGAQLVVKDGKLVSATIQGKPLDVNKIYYIVTIDFVAEGNDKMPMFRNAVTRYDTDIFARDAMVGYVKELTAQGKHITSKIDGRINIQ